MTVRSRSALSTMLLLIVARPALFAQGDAKARAAIEASVARVVDAASHANLDALTMEYQRDASMLSSGTVYPSIDAMRTAWTPIYRSLRSQDIRIDRSNTRLLSPTTAVYTASGTFTSTDTTGQTSAPRRLTWTLVYALDKGAWKIVSGHQAFGAVPAPSVAQAGSEREAARTAIRAHMDRWIAKSLANDRTDAGAFFTEDAVIMPPNAKPFVGRAGAQAWVNGYPNLTAYTVDIDDFDVREDLAVVSGRYMYAATLPNAGSVRQRGTYVEIHKRQPDGSWPFARLIFHPDTATQLVLDKAPVSYQSAATAKYAAVPGAPNVTSATLYGSEGTDAPHAELIKFTPGADMGRHVHTNTVTLVVLKGAYLYRDDAGEKRVAAGDWLRIPGGKVHWSGADKKDGATFYMHMDAMMDQKPAP